MNATWLLLLAILLPALTGLGSMLLPRHVVTPRVLLVATAFAASFVIIYSQLNLSPSESTSAAELSYHAPDHQQPGSVVHLPTGIDAHGTDPQIASSLGTDPVATPVLSWVPDFHLNLVFLPDGLGGFFGLLVAGIGFLIVFYARGYFGGLPPPESTAHADLYRFYPSLGFFATAMLGLVLSDAILLTLLFWELTSISSFLLIGWNRSDRHAVNLAIQAFVTTGLGGLFLLGGLALLGADTGLWRWSELLAAAAEGGLRGDHLGWALGLIFIGAAAKSAQFPLHYWLPGAMAAPTPVSAYLHSATMVKAGVFLMGRCLPIFVAAGGQTSQLWVGLLVAFGAVTMLYGGITAVCKHDLKQIFAYTTVSQLGLLMAMYGLSGVTFESHHKLYPALDLDITQIANHAFYKAPLFITAGAIGHVASRSLPHLRGALFKHPAICVTMLAAAYALAALPGSISFQAKELFLYAAWHAAEASPLAWLLVLMTILTAACNVAVFVRLLLTFWGVDLFSRVRVPEAHEAHHHAHEHGLWAAMIWLPAVPLVALQFLGGLATPIWNLMLMPFERHTNYFDAVPWLPSFKTLPLYLSLLAVVLGLLLALSPLLRAAHPDAMTRAFPATRRWVELVGIRLGRFFHNGNLRHYLYYVFGVLLLGCAAAFVADPGFSVWAGFSVPRMTEPLVGVFFGAMICVTAVMLPLTPVRIVRVLVLGACGFAVVGMYVIFQAPDLALTQLFFEIISVLVFVLVLRMLPSEQKTASPLLMARIPVAAAAGLAVGWLTLMAAGSDPQQRLGRWFTRMTYNGPQLADGTYAHGGGGFNIVNVILVDFRGFDTLGEIGVLGLAALGVWSMLAGRGRRHAPSRPEAATASGHQATEVSR